MKKNLILNICLLVFFSYSCVHSPDDTLIEEICFETEVLPIFQSNCANSGCHDAVTKEDGLDLSNYQGIMEGVTAGEPRESEVYEYLVTSDLDDIMPPYPYPSMSGEQIQIIKNWIVLGAKNEECKIKFCDSISINFSEHISPIIKDNCVGCHNSFIQNGDVQLENYEQIKAQVDSGLLFGSINADSNFIKMPPDPIEQLDTCLINQIKIWIDEGAKDN